MYPRPRRLPQLPILDPSNYPLRSALVSSFVALGIAADGDAFFEL